MKKTSTLILMSLLFVQAMAQDWKFIGPSRPSSPNSFNNEGIGRIDEIAFDPTNDNIYYVASPKGGVWKTSDNGLSYASLFDQTRDLTASNILISKSNPSKIFVSDGEKNSGGLRSRYLRVSLDGGLNFSNKVLPGFYTSVYDMILDHSNDNKIIICGDGGVHVSNNNGDSWTKPTGLPTVSLEKWIYDVIMHPTNNQIIYAVNPYNVYKSTNGGGHFSILDLDGYSVGFSNTELVVTPDDADALYIFTHASPSFNLLLHRQGSTSLIADGASMCTYPDGTVSSLLNGFRQPNYNWSMAISPVDKEIMYIGAVGLFRTTDGGLNWESILSPSFGGGDIHVDIHAIEFANDGKTPYVGCDGGIYMYNSDNTPWIRKNNIPISEINQIDVDIATNSKIYMATQDNGLHRLQDQNLTRWEGLSIGDAGQVSVSPDGKNVICGFAQGQVRLSVDGGNSFSNVLNTDQTKEASAFIPPIERNYYIPNVIYTAHSNVYRSIDNGRSWIKMSDINEKIYDLTLCRYEGNFIYANCRTKDRGLHRTNDGGETWVEVTWPSSNDRENISGIAVHPDRGLWIYATSFRGKVYKSVDGGMTWTDISLGIPSGLAIYDIEVMEDVSEDIYLGTRRGVYYKSVNSTWGQFGTGLPNVLVSDIVLNEHYGTITIGTQSMGIWQAILMDPLGYPPSDWHASITPNGTQIVCDGNLPLLTCKAPPQYVQVQWYRNGIPIPGETYLQYQPSSGGSYAAKYVGFQMTYASNFINLHTKKMSTNHVEGFEEFPYSWIPDVSNDLSWIRLSGKGPNYPNTGAAGPYKDDYYLSAIPGLKNERKLMTLYSGCVELNDFISPEFRINYVTNGIHLGALYVVAQGNRSGDFYIEENTDLNPSWREALIDLEELNGRTVYFELTVSTGIGPLSDIAIDNLRIVESPD